MVSAKMVSTLLGIVPRRATNSLMELLPRSMTATVSELGIAQSKSPGAGGSSLGRDFEMIDSAGDFRVGLLECGLGHVSQEANVVIIVNAATFSSRFLIFS